jgi:hypothetical protein
MLSKSFGFLNSLFGGDELFFRILHLTARVAGTHKRINAHARTRARVHRP